MRYIKTKDVLRTSNKSLSNSLVLLIRKIINGYDSYCKLNSISPSNSKLSKIRMFSDSYVSTYNNQSILHKNYNFLSLVNYISDFKMLAHF